MADFETILINRSPDEWNGYANIFDSIIYKEKQPLQLKPNVLISFS